MRWTVLTVLAVASCFDPKLGDRPYLCGPDRLCPPGYACDPRGACVRGGLTADARPPDGPLADAPPADAAVSDGAVADGAVADARPADARPPDARVADAAPIDATGPVCVAGCGPESCVSASCGRSPCGYPCKACPVSAIADPCIDHYGTMGDEGDRGLRTCIAEPKRMESCVCGGGGAESWTSCTGGCIDEGCSRARQIGCGFASCGPGEVCCRRGRDSSCASTASACGNLPVAACDGPEDCAGGVCCASDLAETARCVSATTCGAVLTHCHSTADCPVTSPLCCATGPTTGSKGCYATPQGGGCN